ncbi:MAG: (d)CMP kinase [Gammaproteobacteria bacterium]
MNYIPVLTLDGPGGAGKGTVGRRVATRLGWHYLDSGALYRLVALVSLRQGLSADDAATVAAGIPDLQVVFEDERVALDGEDVSRELRTEAVSRRASALAPARVVRAALVERQRALRRMPGLVADGRDMGTVVFPDARVKVFLDASPEERALRRYKQLKEQGFNANLRNLTEELRERDERDANRAVAPLKPAVDAEVIDTTGHPVDWVVDRLLALVANAGGSRG